MKKILVACLGAILSSQTSAFTQEELAQLQEIEQVERQVLSVVNKPQKLIGEQVDFNLPKNAKLSYLYGDPKTVFLAEYIEDGDNIEQWKGYFAAQHKSFFPASLLAHLTITAVKQKCQNLKESALIEHFNKDMQQNQQQPYTWSYFCADKTPQAPYGEGGIMYFIQGKENGFKFWQSWRPQSEQEAQKLFGSDFKNLASSDIGLCNPQMGKKCRYKHPKPE